MKTLGISALQPGLSHHVTWYDVWRLSSLQYRAAALIFRQPLVILSINALLTHFRAKTFLFWNTMQESAFGQVEFSDEASHASGEELWQVEHQKPALQPGFLHQDTRYFFFSATKHSMVLKAVLLQVAFLVNNLRNSVFAHFRVKKVFEEIEMHESAFGQIVLFRFLSQESCVTFAHVRHQKEFLSLASATIGVANYELHTVNYHFTCYVFPFQKISEF